MEPDYWLCDDCGWRRDYQEADGDIILGGWLRICPACRGSLVYRMGEWVHRQTGEVWGAR